jgi:hypothetical protein
MRTDEGILKLEGYQFLQKNGIFVSNFSKAVFTLVSTNKGV